MKTFQKKYGLEPITTPRRTGLGRGEPGRQVQQGLQRAPDVLDVGPSFEAIAGKKGIYARTELAVGHDPGQP